ncbi:PPOX class F420-dependent oxidoreductase [Streptomyces sp. 3MP-14]|uniref:PPOX class F420-dependent oxidoreductase n=1 Tax=Streptomyces mimosae TaxID=2586635 RepID=A0A5N6AT61_9ACTN|nr:MULTISPECIES: pyridoxamine 5'-phosphate oxidase family protein [Streptomyces]KAB8170909.1 PPOX class F420-dependent oxidoreductase [Streptomyces mimosae]KAB8179740.1 PPOX class F420-dependent oxidoreductase [Streptomyces sp. 3MP-14]
MTDEQRRPGPRPLTEAETSKLLAAGRFGVLASLRRTGGPHLSTVAYHWLPERGEILVSSTADRLKTRQLLADGRAALHVRGPDEWSFAVAEGTVEVLGPTLEAGDAAGREILARTAEAAGAAGAPSTTEADEAATLTELAELAELAAERRVLFVLKVGRRYGTALDFG